MNKIYVFATGLDAEVMMAKRREMAEYYSDEILGFVSNDESTWGKEFLGFSIISPLDMHDVADYVVIATQDYYTEIFNQCVTKLKIASEKILSIQKYIRMINTDYQYNRVCNNRISHDGLPTNGRIAVYTAISENYDVLKDPEIVTPGVDYICFSNSQQLNSNIWKIESLECYNDDSAINIRQYKILPHKYLGNYDLSIWIDGSFVIRENLIEYIKRYSKGVRPLFFPHPDRNCIYDEMAALIDYRKEKKSNLIYQAAAYLRDGCPEQVGLVEGGCIVRNHNDEDVVMTMELWWNEVQKYGKRDQIALAYSLWKTGLNFDVCDLNINSNRWIKRCRHISGNNTI